MRFFNCYGNRSRTTGAYGAVFGVFLAQRLAGKPLTIVGNGKQTRDFIHVSDLVNGIHKAAISNKIGKIYNLAGGKEINVNRIAKLIGGKKIYIPKRPGEPDRSCANISRIQNDLKWKPKVSIEEGVKDLLKNIDSFRDAPIWTPKKIRKATKVWFKFFKKKLMKDKILINKKEIDKKIAFLRKKQKKIVLCHGVFDLLHIGHIKHFNEAKSLGDILIVSITSDKFVNKGPNRPIFNQNLRAEALASLEQINYVIINDNESSISIIRDVKPKIYCKGPDYKKNEDDITKKIKKEIAEVRKYGGKIVYTKEQTFSSSKLINLFSDKFSELHRSNIRKIKKNYTYKDIFNFFKDLQKIKILVVGETIIDEYNFCEALGKSGKEPTLVLRDLNKEIYLGAQLPYQDTYQVS